MLEFVYLVQGRNIPRQKLKRHPVGENTEVKPPNALARLTEDARRLRHSPLVFRLWLYRGLSAADRFNMAAGFRGFVITVLKYSILM